MKEKILNFFRNTWIFRKIIITWVIIAGAIAIGWHYNLDKKLVLLILFIFALLTKAFIGLLALIGLVPLIGPIIVNVLSIPFFWILNGLGYFVSIIAIKKGHGKTVLNYRLITIVFLIGVVVGYIIARLLQANIDNQDQILLLTYCRLR
jgi:hypothetical protein